MKKTLLFLGLISLLGFSTFSQSSNSINLQKQLSFESGVGINLASEYLHNFHLGDPTHYVIVKTSIPFIESNGMTSITLNYWGYDANWETVIGWYIFNDKFYISNAYTVGISNFDHIKIFESQGKICLALPKNAFSQYGTLTANKNVGGIVFPQGWAENWKITQLEPLVGSHQLHVNINALNNSLKAISENSISKLHIKSSQPEINIESTGYHDGTPYTNYSSKINFTGGEGSFTFGKFSIPANPSIFGFTNEKSSSFVFGDRTFIGLCTPNKFSNSRSENVQLHGSIYMEGITTINKSLNVRDAISIGQNNGNLGDFKLAVDGKIGAREIEVKLGNWADYVFEKNYHLMPLEKVESYINENGHLPNVPSAKKVKDEGLALGEITKIQQEKIEELTLYIIEMNKRLKELEDK